MPNFKKEGRGFKMKGFTPFTATGLRVPSEEAQDYSHKTEKEPLFYKRYPGEPTDARKIHDTLKYGEGTKGLLYALKGGLALGAGLTIGKSLKSKSYALGALKTLGTKTLPAVAALHFGGKLIKGIAARKRDDEIRRHVNKTQARKTPGQRFPTKNN